MALLRATNYRLPVTVSLRCMCKSQLLYYPAAKGKFHLILLFHTLHFDQQRFQLLTDSNTKSVTLVPILSPLPNYQFSFVNSTKRQIPYLTSSPLPNTSFHRNPLPLLQIRMIQNQQKEIQNLKFQTIKKTKNV